MSGRGRGRGRGGRGTKPRKTDSAGKSGDKAKKITVENAVYSIGNMTEASNFVATTKILINHIEQRYDQGEAVVTYIEDGTDYDFPAPLRPIGDQEEERTKSDGTVEKVTIPLEVLLTDYRAEVDIVNQRKEEYRKSKIKAAALFRGKCNSAMTHKLQELDDYDTIKNDPHKIVVAIDLSNPTTWGTCLCPPSACSCCCNGGGVRECNPINVPFYPEGFMKQH